ncbi:MAG: Hsp33 family molecular chaperone HslO [Candidatus Cloacimonetes bacterium]|nr:Hsp33 family molecular chaperone HslO [Candidatus Cloacimonadota bacterium]
MSDLVIRGKTTDNFIRFFAVDSTETSREAMRIHSFSITAATLFSRIASACLMMSSDLKDDLHLLTLKVDGDGPIESVLATANRKGHLKGYVRNPKVELPLDEKNRKINVGKAVGRGTLTVIKDLGLKNPYNGQVELVSGEIAEDLTYYFVKSDQIPTSVALGVLIEPDGTIRKSGGFIVQLMPQTPEEVISRLEKNLANLPNISDLMDMGYDIEKIVSDLVLKGFGVEITSENQASYTCNCSKERFRTGLKLLGKDELIDLPLQDDSISTECHFCGKKYDFSKTEIEEIIKELERERPDKTE